MKRGKKKFYAEVISKAADRRVWVVYGVDAREARRNMKDRVALGPGDRLGRVARGDLRIRTKATEELRAMRIAAGKTP
jgi:hypothetical protein